MSKSTPDWLTVSQAAALLCVSERTVRRRCESGKLAARLDTTATGKAWLIEAAAIGQSAANTADGADVAAPEEQAQEYSIPADGAAIPTDTADMVRSLGRLEGYAARDMEMLVARAVSSAVTPLVEEIAELRRALAELRNERTPVEAAQSTPVKESTLPAKQSAQRGTRARELKPWQRIAARILGIR